MFSNFEGDRKRHWAMERADNPQACHSGDITKKDESVYSNTIQSREVNVELPFDVVFSASGEYLDDVYADVVRFLRDIYQLNRGLSSVPLHVPARFSLDLLDRIYSSLRSRWGMSASWAADTGDLVLIRRCGPVQTALKVIIFKELKSWNPNAHVAFHIQIPLSRGSDDLLLKDKKSRVICVRECNIGYWHEKPKSRLIMHPLSGNGIPLPSLWIETFFINDRRDRYRALDCSAFIRFGCCTRMEFLAIGLTDSPPKLQEGEEEIASQATPRDSIPANYKGPFLFHWKSGAEQPSYYVINRKEEYLQTDIGYVLRFSILLDPRIYANRV